MVAGFSPKFGLGLFLGLQQRQRNVAMLASVGHRDVETVRVRRLHRDIEPDPMHPAREARDDLPANRFHDAEQLEDPELRRDDSPAAPGGLGNRVIGWKACAVAVAVEPTQERTEHVEALGLQEPYRAGASRVYGDL